MLSRTDRRGLKAEVLGNELWVRLASARSSGLGFRIVKDEAGLTKVILSHILKTTNRGEQGGQTLPT